MLWRNHSRTIVGAAFGLAFVIPSWIIWPDGGNAWDLLGMIGGIMLAFAFEGVLNYCFRETAKPED